MTPALLFKPTRVLPQCQERDNNITVIIGAFTDTKCYDWSATHFAFLQNYSRRLISLTWRWPLAVGSYEDLGKRVSKSRLPS